MAGLGPAIQVPRSASKKDVDHRDGPGDDRLRAAIFGHPVIGSAEPDSAGLVSAVRELAAHALPVSVDARHKASMTAAVVCAI